MPTLQERLASLESNDTAEEERLARRERRAREAELQAEPQAPATTPDEAFATARDLFSRVAGDTVGPATVPGSQRQKITRLYLDRGVWGRTFLRRSLVTAGLLMGGGAGVEGIDTWIDHSHLSDAATVSAEHKQVQSDLTRQQALLQKSLQSYTQTGTTPPSGLIVPLRRQLDSTNETLGHFLPLTLTADWLDQHDGVVSQDEKVLDTARDRLTASGPLQARLDSHVGLMRAWMATSNEPTDVVGELQDAARLVRARWKAGLDAGTAQGLVDANHAMTDYRSLAQLSKRWDQMEALVDTGGAEEKASAKSVFGIAKSNAEAGDLKSAAEQLRTLPGLHARFAQDYKLTIADGPNVKSGVWRYQAGNHDARSYYIVVNATDANGQPVKVLVDSIETGRTDAVSRFAVRVPEAVYEAVKADKQDNGIIDKPDFGTKPAGTLKTTWTVPVSGGAITRW